MPSLRSLPSDLRLFAKYHLRRRVFDHPAPAEAELGVVDLGFDLEAFESRIRTVAARHEVETLERIVYRGREHPMLCVTTRREGTAHTLAVLGGVHGNEHAGILAIPEIIERFAEPTVRLVTIAPVNPVGAAAHSRFNADGFDVNRDFVRFETVEARTVRRVLERERPDFVVSLHEGPQDGSFLFLNRHVTPAVAGRLADAMERGGARLATRDYFGRTLRPPGIAAKSRAMSAVEWLWAAILGMKASGTWCEGLGIPEVTLESSWRDGRGDRRVQVHVDLVLEAAKIVSGAGTGDTPADPPKRA